MPLLPALTRIFRMVPIDTVAISRRSTDGVPTIREPSQSSRTTRKPFGSSGCRQLRSHQGSSKHEQWIERLPHDAMLRGLGVEGQSERISFLLRKKERSGTVMHSGTADYLQPVKKFPRKDSNHGLHGFSRISRIPIRAHPCNPWLI